MTKRTFPVAIAVLALATSGAALGQKKKASPPAETSVVLGGKSVKIDYSAPSVKGRKIFGDLVPYGEIWRTGANAATTLTTDADLDLKGLKVPKGKYTLYSIPTETGLTLVVNKQTGQWGTVHDAKQDLGKVEMEVGKPEAPVEIFTITLKGAGDNKGTLTIAWDKLTASVPFTAQ